MMNCKPQEFREMDHKPMCIYAPISAKCISSDCDLCGSLKRKEMKSCEAYLNPQFLLLYSITTYILPNCTCIVCGKENIGLKSLYISVGGKALRVECNETEYN